MTDLLITTLTILSRVLSLALVAGAAWVCIELGRTFFEEAHDAR